MLEFSHCDGEKNNSLDKFANLFLFFNVTIGRRGANVKCTGVTEFGCTFQSIAAGRGVDFVLFLRKRAKWPRFTMLETEG